MRTDQTEVRRSRRLVISSFSTIGNYDYGFFWYLYQDGTIQCEVKLTGILSTGAVPAGRDAALRSTPQRGRALRADPSALLQLPARSRSRRTVNTVYEEHAEAEAAGPGNPSRSGVPHRTHPAAHRAGSAAADRPAAGTDLAGRQSGALQRDRRARRLPTGAAWQRAGDGQRRVERGEARRVHDQAPLGHAVRRRRALRRWRLSRTSIREELDYPSGRRRTGQSKRPTSCSGTPWGATMRRDPRTGR